MPGYPQRRSRANKLEIASCEFSMFTLQKKKNNRKEIGKVSCISTMPLRNVFHFQDFHQQNSKNNLTQKYYLTIHNLFTEYDT